MACDFANGWGLFVLLNDGPTFVDKVLNQDISSVCMMINYFYSPQMFEANLKPTLFFFLLLLLRRFMKIKNIVLFKCLGVLGSAW